MPHAMSYTLTGLHASSVTTGSVPSHVFTPRRSYRPSKPPQRQRVFTARNSLAISAREHAQYIKEVAVTDSPQNLAALLQVLQVQNNKVVSPDFRAGLHPLVIPLAQSHAPDEPVFTCLLKQVSLTTKNKAMPVVQMTQEGTLLTLAARNTDEYLHRALAAEDVASGPGQTAEAAGPAGQQIYSPGSAQSSLNAYLTQKAGMYPDVVEQLVANHLDKGDSMSALITAEWYMRPKHFPGWGQPYEFAAGLYRQLGRLEESRDSARVALRLPWWSLSSGFAAVRDLAGLQGSAAAVHKALTEQTMAANGALPPGAMPAKDQRQVFVEEADFIMNTVAAGEASWEAIREQLSEKYEQAGLQALADFVAAT